MKFKFFNKFFQYDKTKDRIKILLDEIAINHF